MRSILDDGDILCQSLLGHGWQEIVQPSSQPVVPKKNIGRACVASSREVAGTLGSFQK